MTYRTSQKTMFVLWIYKMSWSLGVANSIANLNSTLIKTAHCWYNTNCNGTIDASFNNETHCCQFGDYSYIKCSQLELKELLMKYPTKKLPSSCVRCPPKTPKKPNVAVCKTSTCRRSNKRCVLAKDRQGNTKAFCLECDVFVKVCGNDNVTYPNECMLYRSSKRKDISVAYHGPCRKNPTCAFVTCKRKHKCVQKRGNGPRCVKQQLFCGMNNVTYASAGDMRRASCKYGRKIYSRHEGPCKGNSKPVVVTKKCRNQGTILHNIIWGRH